MSRLAGHSLKTTDPLTTKLLVEHLWEWHSADGMGAEVGGAQAVLDISEDLHGITVDQPDDNIDDVSGIMEFLEHERVQAVLELMAEGSQNLDLPTYSDKYNKNITNTERLQTTFRVIFFLRQWSRWGKPCYVIKPGLGAALSATSMTKIPSQMFEVPMPTFYVEYEGGRALKGAMVSETYEAGQRCLSLLMIDNSLVDNKNKDAMMSVAIPLTHGQTVDFCMAQTNLWNDEHRRFTNLLLNTVLYLTHEKADLRRELAPDTELKAKMKSAGVKKRKKLGRKLAKLSSLERFVVGRDLKPIIPTEAAEEPGGRRGPRWHMVEGHWRLQACGRKRKDRNLIWIRPHPRGLKSLGRVERTMIEDLP